MEVSSDTELTTELLWYKPMNLLSKIHQASLKKRNFQSTTTKIAPSTIFRRTTVYTESSHLTDCKRSQQVLCLFKCKVCKSNFGVQWSVPSFINVGAQSYKLLNKRRKPLWKELRLHSKKKHYSFVVLWICLHECKINLTSSYLFVENQNDKNKIRKYTTWMRCCKCLEDDK